MNTDHKIPAPRITYHKKAILLRPDPARIWLRISIAAAITVGVFTTIYCNVNTEIETTTASTSTTKTTIKANVEIAVNSIPKIERANREASVINRTKVEKSNASNTASQQEEIPKESDQAVALDSGTLHENDRPTASTSDPLTHTKTEEQRQQIIIVKLTSTPQPTESPQKSGFNLINFISKKANLKQNTATVIKGLKDNFTHKAEILPELWAEVKNITNIDFK